jgi:DNA-binding transcriptional regulator YiaG
LDEEWKMSVEIWKDIPGYEDLYRASNHGRVRSLDRHTKWGNLEYIKKGRILKNRINADGYIKVGLHKDNKQKTYGAHVLVLMAFDRIPKDNEECNHKDGIKSNNFRSNLEWMTHKENCDHRDNILNKHNRGERQGSHKLTEKDVKEIKSLLREEKLSQRKIAKLYNVSQYTICKIKTGKTWKHLKWIEN